jgi:hypothetical protein
MSSLLTLKPETAESGSIGGILQLTPFFCLATTFAMAAFSYVPLELTLQLELTNVMTSRLACPSSPSPCTYTYAILKAFNIYIYH